MAGWQSCLHAEDGPLVERAKEEAKVRVVHQCYHDEAGPKTDCLAGPIRETARRAIPPVKRSLVAVSTCTRERQGLWWDHGLLWGRALGGDKS